MPHDTVLGKLYQEKERGTLNVYPLKKVRPFGSQTKTQTQEIAKGLTFTTAPVEAEDNLRAHQFIRNLELLMNAYCLIGLCSYSECLKYVTFFEDQVYPAKQQDRVPLQQAIAADEQVRTEWGQLVRTQGKTLSQAMEVTESMRLSLLQPQYGSGSNNPQDKGGLKRPWPQQDGSQPKGPRTQDFRPYGKQQSKRPWAFKSASGKQFCFNWNSGSCADDHCGREHSCAVPGCNNGPNCRGFKHDGYYRPSVGKGGGSKGK